MIEYVLLTALTVLAVIEFLDGRLMHRLDEHCVKLSCGPRVNTGLLNWYAQGFERPLCVARWLVRASAGLLAACLLLRAEPAIMVATALVLAIGVYELRFGTRLARRHLQFARLRSGDR